MMVRLTATGLHFCTPILRPSMRSSMLLAALMAALVATAPPADAQNLGRLFATPAERDAMEAQRGAGTAPAAVAMPAPGVQPMPGDPNQPMAGNPATAPVAAAPTTLLMGGSMRSSTGRSTVWLNNVPQNDGLNRFSNTGKADLSVTLPSGQRIVLKPGQRYDLSAARVKDVNEP
ncbi:hypothetical protein ACFFKC_09710 [Pseudoduganella danionis]|uniref:Uncharacterized protein n=1 Tax=Pseudoduganella danionis TaxID=1890295 RepID=A0ABW9SLC8_9BURK|nr:hypothetical protein [Pseudoduganella danionis]MTW32700.1 hypothetical protein [Pseudoduganella danionis]